MSARIEFAVSSVVSGDRFVEIVWAVRIFVAVVLLGVVSHFGKVMVRI